ncbi:glycosyltransferase family 4 protein [Kerstersia gyiorum]|uniref:glycosyltransferase n=1 Tax=Kerstersia gyiorum TaxID=206506 RepID=UPI00214FDE81|nr:glycosyltransferase family 4 protein [Kerstersia gyiorum]MCR4158984.1 glycosyltransferase family 4 protein [Kerstersia gyiorum]
MKKRILFVHDHIFAVDQDLNYFSEGKITDSVFGRYKKIGRNIKVICRSQKKENFSNLDEITDPDVSFYPVKGIDFKRIFLFNFFDNFFKILKNVRNSDFVVLRLPSFLGIFVFFLLMVLKKKYAVEFVGHPKEAIVSTGQVGVVKRIFAEIFSYFNKIAVRKSVGTIYVTKERLQSEYPCPGISGVASNVILNIDKKYKRNYIKKNASIVIGMIGSFKNSYKGIDIAIATIAQLRDKGIKCELRILGTGDKKKYIELARNISVDEYVFFDGVRASGREVYNWLDSLDIYVQPSRTEGLPRALIEAMSRALPCISSNAGGMPELLEEQYVFCSENIEEFTAKISPFLMDENIRMEAGLKNFRKSFEYDDSYLKIKREIFWSEISKVIK